MTHVLFLIAFPIYDINNRNITSNVITCSFCNLLVYLTFMFHLTKFEVFKLGTPMVLSFVFRILQTIQADS